MFIQPTLATSNNNKYHFVNDWDLNIPDSDSGAKWQAVGWQRAGRQPETFYAIYNGRANLRLKTVSSNLVDTVAFAQGQEPHQGSTTISKILSSNTTLTDAVEADYVIVNKSQTYSPNWFFYPRFKIVRRESIRHPVYGPFGIYSGFTLGFAIEAQHRWYNQTSGTYQLSDYTNGDMKLGGYGKPWAAAATFTDMILAGEYYVPNEGWKIFYGAGTGQFSSEYTDLMSISYQGWNQVEEIGVWYNLKINLTLYWEYHFEKIQEFWNSSASALGYAPSEYPILTELYVRQYALYLEGVGVDVEVEVEHLKMEVGDRATNNEDFIHHVATPAQSSDYDISIASNFSMAYQFPRYVSSDNKYGFTVRTSFGNSNGTVKFKFFNQTSEAYLDLLDIKEFWIDLKDIYRGGEGGDITLFVSHDNVSRFDLYLKNVPNVLSIKKNAVSFDQWNYRDEELHIWLYPWDKTEIAIDFETPYSLTYRILIQLSVVLISIVSIIILKKLAYTRS